MSYDPYFIQTEFEVLQSQAVLGKVAGALTRNSEWTREYAKGGMLTTNEAIAILKKHLQIKPVHNSRLIDVSFTSRDPHMAANVANAIAKAYQDYRLETRRQMTLKGIEVLQKEYQEEAKKIQIEQTNMESQLFKTFISISVMTGSTLVDAENEYTNDQSKLEKLRSLSDHGADRSSLGQAMATTFVDSELSQLLTALHENEKQYISLTNQYSLADPKVLEVRSNIFYLDRDIDARIKAVFFGLEEMVKSDKARVDQMKARTQQDQEEAKRNALKTKPYWDEKRKLDSMIALKKQLQVKIAAEKINLQVPKASVASMVQIVEAAQPPKSPTGPNRLLGTVLLILGLFPTICGWLLFKSSSRQSV